MPGMPLPDPAGLPAPIWLLKFLSVFTLSLHLIAMNLLVGGTLLMAIAWRRSAQNPTSAWIAQRLSRVLPVTMSLTITLGVAPLLFVQVIYGQAFYTSSVLMAWPWLAIVPLVLLAYYGLYACQFRPEWLGRAAGPVAWVSAVFILITGFLFSNNWTLMLSPEHWHEMYNQGISGLNLNLGEPTLLPRYLHMILGALAVAGLGIGFLARTSRADNEEAAREMENIGRRWFLIATGINIIVGLWFLFAIPREIRRFFIGGNMVDSGVLAIGILLAFVAMAVVRRRPGLATVLTGLTVFLMTAVRHRLRQITLEPRLRINSLEVNPQWAMLIVFVVVLLAGLAVLAWMVMALLRGKGETPAGEATRGSG